MKPKKPFTVNQTTKEVFFINKSLHVFVGQFRDEIVSKVKALPNFLNEILVQNLQTVTENSNTSSLFNNVLDFKAFGNYLKTKTRDVYENLDKIAEATGTSNK